MNGHVTDEERKKRIKRVLELTSEGKSYRECANIMKAEGFKISHVTVKDYVERGKMIDNQMYLESIKTIENNKPKSVNDEDVLIRIKQVYELLKQGFTFEEIAKNLNSTPFIVYRDFKKRISLLTDEQLIELNIEKKEIDKIEKNLKNNSLENLKKVI